MLVSGIIYDIIFVPPSSGQFVDGSGKARVLSMRLGRQNIGRQYIIEGLSAGFLVVAGSVGVMLLMVWQLLFICMHLCFFWVFSNIFDANSVFKSLIGLLTAYLNQTANSDDNKRLSGNRGGNSRALQIIAGFICFAVGFNGVSGLTHQKLPGYLLSV